MIIGRRLNGRYKIIEMIGGGGMANVYLAHDIILDRDVAVKVLKPEFSNDDEFIKRFRREAHSATSLDHPKIVSIFDVGEEDDIYYIVMEYVEGTTLKQFIQQRRNLSVEEVVDIMKQITSAIDHAHQNQIVHRDIKPHNILIDYNGSNVKVTDFGIAMALSATSITQTNSVLGSVHYLSPEQARGGMANKKSDIYSLGVVMFELLTGRLPFSGESAISIALKHLQSETPSPKRWNPAIPQSVENIVLKATVKDSFLRYDSVAEMLEDLETALEPSRLNEAPFVIPEDDEATKAIPIITDEHLVKEDHHTIVHPVKKEKSKTKRLLMLLLTIGLILGGTLAAAFIIVPPLLEPKDVIIPDVTEQSITDAIEELQSVGLKVKTEQLIHDTISEGNVIKTNPPANSTVKEGYEVIVYESLGKEKINFTSYVGMQLQEATRELELLGINADHILPNYIESNAPENEITAQLQPKPDEQINPDEIENMWVIFQVSKGPSIKIPNMIGWGEQQVNQFVQKNNLNLDNSSDQQYSSDVDQGLVISQSPEANTYVKKNSTIKIVLSKGPEPKTYQFSKVIPIEDEETTEHKVELYIEDMEHEMESEPEVLTITETTEIPIKLIIPYNGSASYKIYVDGIFLDGAEISFDAVTE